jgi:hypothetical protein
MWVGSGGRKRGPGDRRNAEHRSPQLSCSGRPFELAPLDAAAIGGELRDLHEKAEDPGPRENASRRRAHGALLYTVKHSSALKETSEDVLVRRVAAGRRRLALPSAVRPAGTPSPETDTWPNERGPTPMGAGPFALPWSARRVREQSVRPRGLTSRDRVPRSRGTRLSTPRIRGRPPAGRRRARRPLRFRQRSP